MPNKQETKLPPSKKAMKEELARKVEAIVERLGPAVMMNAEIQGITKAIVNMVWEEAPGNQRERREKRLAEAVVIIRRVRVLSEDPKTVAMAKEWIAAGKLNE